MLALGKSVSIKKHNLQISAKTIFRIFKRSSKNLFQIHFIRKLIKINS